MGLWHEERETKENGFFIRDTNYRVMQMKPIMENWRGYLTEGQTGTAFEDVVVAVARGDDPGEKGTLAYKGSSYEDLAIRALAKMNPPVLPGGDPQARKVSGKGISGDPKTDIIIDGKKISLKLPGPIQFASGEAASSSEAMILALKDYLKNHPDEISDIEHTHLETLKNSIDSLIQKLKQTVGKKYLPQGSGGEGYITQLAVKARQDWDRGKWASGSQIPTHIKRQGSVRDVYPRKKDYVNFFVKQGMKDVLKKARVPHLSWERFSAEVMRDLKEKIGALASVDEGYYNLIIDEWLTGRRQFASSPEHIATHLLSPDGYYDISGVEQTAALASEWKDFIKWDVRGKGRNYLAKAVTVRVGFNADKYYRSIEKALGAPPGAIEDIVAESP